jgi:hypothetical protein
MQIENTGEVAFDAVVAACEQVVDLWSKSHACRTCPARVHERLLSIYGKLIDLLEGAITTYTSSPPSLSDAPSTSLTSDRQAWRKSSSQYQNDQQDSIMSGALTTPSTPGIACRPSAMSLGEYELNEQQSRHLALDLIGRKLKSLAAILRQQDDIDETRTRVDATLSRVLRLLSTVHRRLVLVQASSIRKTDDIALNSVDTDDYKGR